MNRQDFNQCIATLAQNGNGEIQMKQVVLRIKDVGTPWLGWILAFVFWPIGSVFGLLIILLSPGQNSDNKYGTNPYLKEIAADVVAGGV